MRRVLLWMARSRLLKRTVPRIWFVRRATRRFMPGETIEAALDAAETFRSAGIGILLTYLGENLSRAEQASAVVAHYHDVLDKVRARGLDAEISVKPTQLGLDFDPELAWRNADELARHAGEAGGTFWLDMESSTYTDATLELYRRLKADHPQTGICLQAYLRRTPADVHALLPLHPQIRLVKGAYDEPVAIAHRKREEVDAAFQALSVTMLPPAASGELRLGLGTHDTRLIERIADHARATEVPRSALEVQMLYGIRTDELRRLARDGYRARVLIAYGEAWYPWYMRRLAERPANVLFALRQIVG